MKTRGIRRLYPLLAGGVTLGILQGVGAIRWDLVWTQFFSTWLSVLVRVLFGGDSDIVNLINTQGSFGA